MKAKILLAVVLLATSICASAQQQEQITPEKMEKMMQQQMQMMVPMFEQMMRIMMNTQFDILSQPETAKKLATYTRNYYQALIEAGFAKEEALQIAMNVGIPAAPMMGK